MSKFSKLLIANVLLIGALFLPAQQLVDGIAAIVGENIILYSEMNQYAFEIAQQSGIDIYKDQQAFSAIQHDALRDLVNSKIIILQAEADSIEINERNVEMTVEQQVQQYIQMAGSEEVLEMYFDTPMKKIREMLYERVKSSMISQQLQAEKFSKIKISRPEVIEFYNSNKDSLPDLPERIDIDHILITEKPSPESKQKTLDMIEKVRKDIIAGTITFEDAAFEYSQDPGSAEDGGDLGFVPKGTFVAEFEKAAFALNEGEISEPVETQFGYHLIQTIEIRGELIHARHILFSIQTTESDNQYVINMLSTLRDSIIKSGDFEGFARKYSEDPDVAMNGGHLGEFALETLQISEFGDVSKDLKAGEISEPFISPYGFHILRLNKHIPAEKISLKDHYPILENMALNKKQSVFWENWMEGLYGKYYVEIKF
ncbi:MAG: peptidylprolyl isomerase [Candidatus Marinimicrobia bacterium]|nr:peptidylprolyl isomerase [Candidatus Neomarinimicrobiota bacterium]